MDGTDSVLVPLTRAATALDVSVVTLRRLIKRGSVKAVMVGGRVRVPSAELERVLMDGTARPDAG